MRKSGLHIDSKNNRAYFNGALMPLTRKEFEILELLYMFQGRIVSIDDMMDYLYHDADEEPFAHQIAVLIAYIRRKLPDIRLGVAFGRGYILCDTAQAFEVFSMKKADPTKEKEIIRLLSDTDLSQPEIAVRCGVRLWHVNKINGLFKIRKQNFYKFSDDELRMLLRKTVKERKAYGEKVGVSLPTISVKLARFRSENQISCSKRRVNA